MLMSNSSSSTEAYQSFRDDVNMTAAELERWLQTEKSQSVGQASGDGSSIGHHSGEHIVRMLHKKPADFTPDDEAHLHKVHAYVSRHLAQRPTGNVTTTRWRYSLMNWGHDPLKNGK